MSHGKNSREQAARLLGMHRTGLYQKLERYGVGILFISIKWYTIRGIGSSGCYSILYLLLISHASFKLACG